jgi:uncharacterized protein (DUF305 family)
MFDAASRLAARSLLATALIAGMVVAGAPAVKADGPAPKKGDARFEIKFMQNMIDHHHMAVMMAMMCEERAVHEELLMLCHQIEETQTAEIQEMQAWLADWYDIEYELRMTRRMERQMEDLAELEGEEFEIEFMEMMIEHHEVAIREGRKCVNRAYHEALIDLCQDIVEAQSMEIDQMESWLCDWYGLCD